jgi:outer membrane lipoprotein SlyB
VTLNPARCGASPFTRLTTNPDCTSRFSTLHSAHLPVRGQPPLGGATLPATIGRAVDTLEEMVAVEEVVPAPSEEDPVHAARVAEASMSQPGKSFIGIKDRAGPQASRLLIMNASTGGRMSTIRRIRQGATAALMVASLGACAGNQLGNILGSVLGGGAQSGQQSGQLSGTIRGVDSRSQQISIQQSNGQTVPVSYDNQTQVVYQNQKYSPTALEYGDQVTARVQANGNSYYTDYVQVDQSVTGGANGSSSNVQLLQGTVRQVDRRSGVFTVDVSNNSTLTVTLPNNLSSNDTNTFNNLRSGQYIRFYGTYLSNGQVQLRQFN